MSLGQFIGRHKNACGWAAALIIGASATFGITSAIKKNVQKQDEQEWAAILKNQEMEARSCAFEELWRSNVMKPDAIALADALKAYNEIKPTVEQKMEDAKPKIEEAEHNLRVAQYNSSYEDMKENEQILNDIKNPKWLIEYNNLEKKIDSLKAVQEFDEMLFTGRADYYKVYNNYNFAKEKGIKDYDSVDERYKDVTGRNLSDDIDNLLTE